MKALVGSFKQEQTLVEAFFVILKPSLTIVCSSNLDTASRCIHHPLHLLSLLLFSVVACFNFTITPLLLLLPPPGCKLVAEIKWQQISCLGSQAAAHSPALPC